MLTLPRVNRGAFGGMRIQNSLAIGVIPEGRKVKLDRREAKKVGTSRYPRTSEG